MTKKTDQLVQQSVGFRICNMDKSTMLLYLLKKSTTWTLPGIKSFSNHTLINSLLLLGKCLGTELNSAICIFNKKESIPIHLPGNTTFTDVQFQYIIYDVLFQLKGTEKPKLPDNIRACHFMTFKEITELSYKTPILNHLITHIKTSEK